MYELLVGSPPYYANDRETLYENIKRAPLKVPRTMSLEAKDLIKRVFIIFTIFDIIINFSNYISY